MLLGCVKLQTIIVSLLSDDHGLFTYPPCTGISVYPRGGLSAPLPTPPTSPANFGNTCCNFTKLAVCDARLMFYFEVYF